MADIKSPEERSRNMSRIRSKDTVPEVWLRKKLFAEGYRYRKNVQRITGCPDAWLPKYNLAIFVHGCFWHRHEGCKYASTPSSRTDYWIPKFQRNIERDNNVRKQLTSEGIRCLIVWECTVKNMMRSTEKEKSVLLLIEQFVRSDQMFCEL